LFALPAGFDRIEHDDFFGVLVQIFIFTGEDFKALCAQGTTNLNIACNGLSMNPCNQISLTALMRGKVGGDNKDDSAG